MNTDNKGQQNQNQGGGQRMGGNGSQNNDPQKMSGQNQGGNQNQNNNNRGNFANDPERAREAGRKGGQS